MSSQFFFPSYIQWKIRMSEKKMTIFFLFKFIMSAINLCDFYSKHFLMKLIKMYVRWQKMDSISICVYGGWKKKIKKREGRWMNCLWNDKLVVEYLFVGYYDDICATLFASYHRSWLGSRSGYAKYMREWVWERKSDGGRWVKNGHDKSSIVLQLVRIIKIKEKKIEKWINYPITPSKYIIRIFWINNCIQTNWKFNVSYVFNLQYL